MKETEEKMFAKIKFYKEVIMITYVKHYSQLFDDWIEEFKIIQEQKR